MERPSSSAARVARRPSMQPPPAPSPSPSVARSRMSRSSSVYGRSPSAASTTSPRPPSARGFVDEPVEFGVGDLVYVPGGLRGVVLYIGQVVGKNGEFAGVDLLGPDADKGKNNGTVNGVRYFNPSHPTSGIFVPLAKLSTNPTSTATPVGTPRPSSVLSQRAPSRGSILADRSKSPMPSASSTSTGGVQTPGRRTSLANMAGSGRTSRTSMNRPSLFFSPSSTAQSASTPTAPRTSAPNAAKRKSTIGTAPVTASRLSRTNMSTMFTGTSDDDAESDIINKSSALDDQLTTQMAALRLELEQTSAKLEAKEAEFTKQSTILIDMENTLAEFQALSEAQQNGGSDGEADSQPPTRRELDLRTLLQDKDAKLEALQLELDSKRKEFRDTMEALEQANLASMHVYEAQLDELRSHVQAANGVVGDIQPLERMITELETGLEDARINEKSIRGELEVARLAITEKQEEIKRLKEQLKVAAIGGSSVSSVSFGDESLHEELSVEKKQREKLAQEVAHLERIIESKVFREQELEKELVQVREQLSAALDSLRNERAQIEVLQHQLQNSQDMRLSAPQKAPVVPKTPLKPTSNVSLNGNTRFGKSENNHTRSVLWCEICEAEGHDIIDCKVGGYGSTVNGKSSPGIASGSRQSPTKTESGKKLWCALCERDGHASMDCPYDGL
ncbi:hypothetical protein POJ06DRAFT_244982 [Lipomyces tetrasporus]|uniref:CAP-Gly domain-containing protein n=1 Tax=Lipomyces tetrasporus TaxID=54092 RepID=A0AAD7VVT7_9ASCO|nr:uncharacterized protein POJ06DRAFT_244982 [Lipomyces tetrasporus]KAJ8102550.1 hypothetical protein POJ06DRAFT_244982 [Lipomyces tetrasporus]